MWLCLGKRFPPLWLHWGILNSSCVLILLIHTKHKYKNMKSWTDPTSSFPWRRTHPLDRQGKKLVTNSRVAAHKSWMVKCSPSRSGILAEAINTKILTKNDPDFPHSYPDSLHSHPDSPHSPHSQHSHSFSPCIPTLIPHISTTIPCIPALISRIPTLIPRVATLIPHVSIIPLILFADSPFRLL